MGDSDREEEGREKSDHISMSICGKMVRYDEQHESRRGVSIWISYDMMVFLGMGSGHHGLVLFLHWAFCSFLTRHFLGMLAPMSRRGAQTFHFLRCCGCVTAFFLFHTSTADTP